MPKSSKPEKKSIEQYDHTGKERMNNPPVGDVTPETDSESGKNIYPCDPRSFEGIDADIRELEKKTTAILQEVAG